MKRITLIVLFTMTISTVSLVKKATAQAEEIEQLLLDVEKLNQFKQILSDLKKGYEIVHSGYNTIKDLSEGNFNLHKTFLDGLMQVSPAVTKYKRIADIINDQITLIKEYKRAFNRSRQNGVFSEEELLYISSVYSNLFNQSLRDLDELSVIITSDKLRMSDNERLLAIDRIYEDMEDKLVFLREFNNNTAILYIQREKEKNDAGTIKKIYGIDG